MIVVPCNVKEIGIEKIKERKKILHSSSLHRS